MGIVIVDGQEIEVADHERLNGIEVAKRAGVEIPHYCWHPGLSVVASCRMCLVETGVKAADTGKITMLPKLVPACQTPAKPGTVFVTESDNVKRARAMVEEDLLIDHPIDCPICDKAGECLLQDYHFEHGQTERRADVRPFTSRRRDMGPTVTLFVDRCVMCTRCVRFTREVSGTSELLVINRGSHEEIDIFPGYPLDNKMSGNVVDLCPVGALGDKDFLYKQRVWFMKKHEGVCASCSTGCSVFVEENQDAVYRLKPRDNQFINGHWMCDEGRYNYAYIHRSDRLLEPRRRDDANSTTPNRSGQRYTNVEWSQIPRLLESQLPLSIGSSTNGQPLTRPQSKQQPSVGPPTSGRLGVVISPYQTVEDAYLLCKLARSIDANALLAMGPIPIEGHDEKFKSGFIIHAEKCPNRRGVEAVLEHFGEGSSDANSESNRGPATTWEQFLTALDDGQVTAAWVAAGYRDAWIDEATAARFDKLRLLIVHDLFDSPLWQRATFQLPGAGYAERSGSYVNYQQRLQSFKWAIRPPAGVHVEGHLFWQLLGMAGMYNARAVLNEVAAEIPYFAAAMDPVPATGVDLRVNLLASTTT